MKIQKATSRTFIHKNKLEIFFTEYALDKKVEVDLWNFCFKDYIAYLQSQVKEFRAAQIEVSQRNHGSRKAAELGIDPNITLHWFLGMASGFYILYIYKDFIPI